MISSAVAALAPYLVSCLKMLQEMFYDFYYWHSKYMQMFSQTRTCPKIHTRTPRARTHTRRAVLDIPQEIYWRFDIITRVCSHAHTWIYWYNILSSNHYSIVNTLNSCAYFMVRFTSYMCSSSPHDPNPFLPCERCVCLPVSSLIQR